MNITNAKQKLLDFMSVRSDNPDLVKAQYRAFTRQMPMMYFILISSTWALATTHLQLAPFWLTIGIPAFLHSAAPSGSRSGGGPAVSIPRRRWLMQRFSAQIAAAGIAVVFTLWSFLLVPYGDAYTQSHVAFYMAITVISCIFCLMYVRSAAFMVTAIVNGAFVIFLASQQPTFIAIAINVLLVCAGMMSILLTNYRNFERMIVSQQRGSAEQ